MSALVTLNAGRQFTSTQATLLLINEVDGATSSDPDKIRNEKEKKIQCSQRFRFQHSVVDALGDRPGDDDDRSDELKSNKFLECPTYSP